MDRIETVLGLIALRNCKRYLEIGCNDDACFSRVTIEKVGVDPVRGGTVRATSDAYFAQAIATGERFDIIFIDGDHRHPQVLRDVDNALQVLVPGGVIVMHDCLPPDERHEATFLCGTAWRAFAKLRERADLDCVCGDYDYGVGLVQRGENPAPIDVPPMDALSYRHLVQNRAAWMRPVSVDDMKTRLGVITSKGGTGLTSELSVRLHFAAGYHREHGRLPRVIEGREQFWLYRDHPAQDVSARLLGPVKQVEVERTEYDHGWCFGWCDQMNIPELARMALATCAPSDEVRGHARNFAAYMEDRTAVVYRGNDKVKDSPLVDYDTVVEMARDTGSARFIVQTDELDFFEYFKSKLSDTVHFPNFPMIRRDPNKYVLPAQGKRTQFAVEFFAALCALSQASKLCIVTGNIGMWLALLRGSVEDMWQADGREKAWRRLG